MGLIEFIDFYRTHLNLQEDDFEIFIDNINYGLPSAFRISQSVYFEKVKYLLEQYDFVKKIPFLENVYNFDLKDKSQEYKDFIKILVAQSNIGAVQRQEVVSMLPHLFLDVQSHHCVLETCASPGSKTKNLLEIIKEGVLISNDKSPSRVNVLVSESSKKANSSLIITQMDATNFTKLNFKFDRICCDVPCTSDGTFRKMPTILPKWNIKDAISLSSVQIRILKRSLELVKNDGIVVYSTCSLNPIENEYVIDSVIKCFDVEIVSDFNFIQYFGDSVDPSKITVRHGLTKFEYGEYSFNNERLKNCFRILPHDQNTGGFFITVLKKKGVDVELADNVTDSKGHRTFVTADDQTLNRIGRKYDLSHLNDRFVSFNSSFKNLFSISNRVYNILMENQKLKVVFAGVKAFVSSDLSENDYRAKNDFLVLKNINTEYTMNSNDFKLLVNNREVLISELSFSPKGLYTVQLDTDGIKFSGFANGSKTFLYIDGNSRDAYKQLYQ